MITRNALLELDSSSEQEIIALAKSIDNDVAKDGRLFQRVKLCDKSGTEITAMAWESARIEPVITIPTVMRFLINGQHGKDGTTFFTIIRYSVIPDANISDYMPPARIDKKAAWKRLIRHVKNMRQPLGEVISKVINLNRMEFVQYPMTENAAYSVQCGLLESTIKLVESASYMSRLYGLDHDLAVAGAIIYNIGSTSAMNISGQDTLESVLIGNSGLAFEKLIIAKETLINKYMTQGAQEHVDLLMNCEDIRLLQHIVLSKTDAVKTAIPEALLLHYLDRINSGMDVMQMQIQNIESGSFENNKRRIFEDPPYRLYHKTPVIDASSTQCDSQKIKQNQATSDNASPTVNNENTTLTQSSNISEDQNISSDSVSTGM